MFKATLAAALFATGVAFAAPGNAAMIRPSAAPVSGPVETVQYYRHYDRYHHRHHHWARHHHRAHRVCRVVREHRWRHHHRVVVHVRRCFYVR